MVLIQPLKASFANNEANRAYRHFFDNMGINNSNGLSRMTKEKFIEGSTIIPFDLTPDMCAMYHAHKKETGNIELSIKFSSNLDISITILAFCNYSDRMYFTGSITERELKLSDVLAGQ